MQAQYVTQRIRKEVVESLRTFEKQEKRKASITKSLDYLLRFHKLVKKEDKDLYNKINFHLN